MKEKFSRIPESLFRDDRFTPQEKIIVGFRLGMTDTGYWTYKTNTVAELFGVKRNVVMKSYRKMKQYGFLEETEDKQFVMKSIMAESGSISMCSEMTTLGVSNQIQGCIQPDTLVYPNEYIGVSKQIHECIQMNTPTPPVFIGKTETVKNIKEDIKNTKELIMNTKQQLTEQLKKSIIQFAIMKLNIKGTSVYNKEEMNSEFVYYKSKGSNDWVGLSKSEFLIAYKQYNKTK